MAGRQPSQAGYFSFLILNLQISASMIVNCQLSVAPGKLGGYSDK
jgi:hypothetical protein